MGTTRILCFVALLSCSAALCEYYLLLYVFLLLSLLLCQLFIVLQSIVHSTFPYFAIPGGFKQVMT